MRNISIFKCFLYASFFVAWIVLFTIAVNAEGGDDNQPELPTDVTKYDFNNNGKLDTDEEIEAWLNAEMGLSGLKNHSILGVSGDNWRQWETYVASAITGTDLTSFASSYKNNTPSTVINSYNITFSISGNQLFANNTKQLRNDIDSFMNSVADDYNNSMILYQTQSIDDIDKFILWDEYYFNGQWYDYTKSNVTNLITSNFSDEDYPLYFAHSTSSIGIVSLGNISGDYSCDGLVCNYNWFAFLERFTAFQNNGYLNNLNGQELFASFNVYASSRLFQFLPNDFKSVYDGSVLSNPFTASAYYYSEYRPTMIRNQSCIISQDGTPMIFFKDTQSYLNYYSNNKIIQVPPNYPLSSFNEPIDYTDLLNSLDTSAINSSNSLSAIYKLLDEGFSGYFQELSDKLTSTNGWLKKIYKELDKWHFEWDLAAIGSGIHDIVDTVDDLIDIMEYINIINKSEVDILASYATNASLTGLMSTKMPFCLPDDFMKLLNAIQDYGELKPVFSVSSNAFGVPIYVHIDFEEDIPGWNVVRFIIRWMIVIVFLFGLYQLTIKIMESMGGD